MPRNAVTKVKRGKAGKGKKEGKQETKAVKESDVEKAKASAALWELRLRATEQALAEYREDCRALGRANEQLTSQLYRAEKDWLDITGFLKRQDAAKEEKIRALQRNLQSQDKLAREEQNKLVDEYTTKINEMNELSRKKSRDFYFVQEGMKKIDEFQKRKAEMEQELGDMRENMDAAEKEHKENLNKMEFKFFQEKSRLEREAEQRIALVEERAHSEAIVQLDDASRSVFKENVRLNEALKYHIKEAQQLQTLTNSMAKENASMALDKNTYELMVKENTVQMEAQRKELSKLRAKEASLEQALKLKAGEPEREQEKAKASVRAHAAGRQELEKLQKALCARERELGHVRRLANAVVEQRSELERFFHQGIAQVKQEIAASRSRYKKEALQAYRWRMREATAGRLTFPPIRTFQKGPRSTNSVYSDMEEAASWTHPPGSNVEISDLTWEQKEQVLRLLFAKMNGRSERNACQHLALSASSEKRLGDIDAAGIREQLSPATFITQAPEPVLPSNPSSLPDIRTA